MHDVLLPGHQGRLRPRHLHLRGLGLGRGKDNIFDVMIMFSTRGRPPLRARPPRSRLRARVFTAHHGGSPPGRPRGKTLQSPDM